MRLADGRGCSLVKQTERTSTLAGREPLAAAWGLSTRIRESTRRVMPAMSARPPLPRCAPCAGAHTHAARAPGLGHAVYIAALHQQDKQFCHGPCSFKRLNVCLQPVPVLALLRRRRVCMCAGESPRPCLRKTPASPPAPSPRPRRRAASSRPCLAAGGRSYFLHACVPSLCNARFFHGWACWVRPRPWRPGRCRRSPAPAAPWFMAGACVPAGPGGYGFIGARSTGTGRYRLEVVPSPNWPDPL